MTANLKVYSLRPIENKGEKQVFEALAKIPMRAIGHLFSFAITNWENYGDEFEADFLLVGKAGTYAIEVKNGKISVHDGVY